MTEQKNNEPKDLVAVQEIQRSIKERIDEDYVVQEITGLESPEFFYKFPIGGRTVEGISSKGAIALKSAMANVNEILREESTRIVHESEDEVRIEAEVSRYKWFTKDGSPAGEVKLDTALGHAEHSKWMKKKDGTIIPDDKAFRKACSKALRNAILKLVPVSIKKQVMEQARKEGLIRTISESDVASYAKSKPGKAKKGNSKPEMTPKQEDLINKMLPQIEDNYPDVVRDVKKKIEGKVSIGEASEIIENLKKKTAGAKMQEELGVK